MLTSISFVVYRLKTPELDVTYEYLDLPEGWRWIGGGEPPSSFSPKFNKEDQFFGSHLSEEVMRKYLVEYFDALVVKGEVEEYAVCKCRI